MKTILLLFALGIISSEAFFFPAPFGGAGSGVGCSCQPAACPPAPACPAAPPVPVCPPSASCGGGCNGGNCGGASVYSPPGCAGASCGRASFASPVISGCTGVGCLPVFQQPQQPIYYQQQAQPAPLPAAPAQSNYIAAPQQVVQAQQQAQPAPLPAAPAQSNYIAAPQQVGQTQQQAYQQQAPPQQISHQNNPVAVEASPLRSEGYSSSGSSEQYVQAPPLGSHAVAGEKLQEVVDDVETSTTAELSSDAAANETLAHDISEAIPLSELKLTDDSLCNNEDLRKLMLDNIDDNLNTSKRLIQLAAETAFGGRFDVICANGDFSYITNTELFCQETKGDVSCYTYRQI